MNDLEQAQRVIALAKALRDRRRARPWEWYQPHEYCTRGPNAGLPSGQLQFHQATHKWKVVATGNGWGGTTALAAEVYAVMTHNARWRPMRQQPAIGVWFCEEFRQMAMIRQNSLDPRIFGSVAKYTESGRDGPRYEFPDGGKLFLASYDGGWKHIQGVEFDIAACDETPPKSLADELSQRLRGERDGCVVCKATQTEGWTWMAEELYLPWLKYHEERGLDEAGAMLQQLHPDLWLWTRGGPHDNLTITDAQLERMERKRWRNRKERLARLFGGFYDFTGDCIFDEDGLDWIMEKARECDRTMGEGKTGGLRVAADPRDGATPTRLVA